MMLNNQPTYVVDSQKGDIPVVFLHGYLETLAVWDSFCVLLEPLIRSIRLDLPGHGLSQAAGEVQSVSDSAKTVKEYLDKACIPRAFIVGHSMGGYVAQSFASQFPKSVAGLILFHSTPFPDSEEKKQQREREIKSIEEGKLWLLAETSLPNLLTPLHQKRFETELSEIIWNCEQHSEDGIKACIRGMMERPSFVDFLKETDLPLLLVFGKEDYHISLEKANEAASLNPNASLLFLDDVGHLGFVEAPELLAAKMIEFTTRNY